MADPTSDWLKRHKKIGKNFAKFLKLSGPISSLVAAGLDTAFQPESDEFIAISKLNTDVIKGFQKVSEELQSIGNRVFHRMNMIDYRNNVVFTMMNLQEIVDIATQPSPDFQIKGKLKETCIGKDGPMLTLMGKLASVCANVVSNGDQFKVERYLNRTQSLSEIIINFMGEWAEQRLDIQFPETQIKFATIAIGNDTITIDKYNETAEIFVNELVKRGLTMRHYSVVITDQYDDFSMFYGPKCTRNTTCHVFKHSNIKITTLRQKVRPEIDAINSQNFANTWRPRLRELIAADIKTDNLTMIAQDIESEVELTVDKYFHNFLLLRMKSYFAMFCIINFGIYSQETGIIKSSSLIDYYVNPMREDAQ
uniref:Major capsid protein n=1 Tax=Meloidogyne hapla TaxID=6305 RepID=A0A1I8B819_MELHA